MHEHVQTCFVQILKLYIRTAKINQTQKANGNGRERNGAADRRGRRQAVCVCVCREGVCVLVVTVNILLARSFALFPLFS